MDNLMVFKGPNTPHIRIGDLGSCVQLGRNGVDTDRNIKWCITTHTTAAHEMLIAGQTGPDPVTLTADLYSWGVVMMELAGRQHPEFPQQKSPVGKKAPAHLRELREKCKGEMKIFKQRFNTNPDFLSLLEIALRFDINRTTALALADHKAFNDVKDGFLLERRIDPC